MGRRPGRAVSIRNPVDHVDRAGELDAIGDRRDDLVTGCGTDRGNRGVVGRLRERDDELAVVEVDGQRRVLACRLGRNQCRRVLVDRRLEEVDEADAHVGRERGRQVLATDEPAPQEHGGEGYLLLLRFVERVFEVVTGKYVTLDERLSESTGLTGEHAGSPAAPVALFLTTAADSSGFVSAGPPGC